jgi:predicted ATPase
VVFHPERYPALESYPYNLAIFRETADVSFHTPVTFFVGENGTGKSTLLKALAKKCRIAIWEGDRRTRFQRSPYEDDLHKAIDVEWNQDRVPGSYFASEIFRNFAQLLDEWASADPGLLKYFGGESLMSKSHGQSLLAFFEARYRIRGLYYLDEPETALSPQSQLGLLRILDAAARTGEAQFIMATHSPILLALPGARLLSFDHATIREVPYTETEHYLIYKDFMADHKKYLREIQESG